MTATENEHQQANPLPPPSAGPPAAPPSEDAPMSDDAVRREAVARLSENLSLSTDLLAWCERTIGVPKGRRTDALFAASRVMNASAHIAKALAELTQVERRRRTIIERIETPRRISNGSISNPVEREIDALTDRLARYMNVVASETFGPTIEQAEKDAAAKKDSAAAEAAATPPAA
jgi:hypothetical protein